jgi:DNA-directed RNA polymerase beta subunit
LNNNIKNLYDLEPPEHTRGFFDPIKTRQLINDYVLKQFQHSLNKIETPDLKLDVSDIHLVDPNKKFSFKEQKDAILERKDLTLPIKGTFKLIDKKTGKVLEEKKTTIAHIPYITDRNTAVLNGSEYIVTNQQRLKPGVYTRIKESGEVEAHVNVKSGTGVGGKVIFHSDKAIFVYQIGTTQIKLYGLLHDLGVSDSDIEKAWGHEIYLRNKASYEGNEIDKFYHKIFKEYE